MTAALGTIVAGAISMHGQMFLADGEDIIHNCRVAKCKTIILDPGDTKGAWPVFRQIQYTDEKTGETRYQGLPDLTTVIHIKVSCIGNGDQIFKRGLQCLKEEKEMFEEPDVREDDIAIIFSTSGTTGFSKQVPHTHRALLRFGRVYGFVMGIKSEHTRYLAHRSLGWFGGYPGPNLVFGATRVLRDVAKGMPEEINEHIFKILNEYNIDGGYFSTGEIDFLLKSFSAGKKLQRRLNTFGLGGMPITKRILKAIGTITDAVYVAYGATEFGLASYLYLTADSVFEDFCAGVPIDGAEIKVVDTNYTELPRGEIGEIAIRHEVLTPGYLNEPAKTRKVMANGEHSATD